MSEITYWMTWYIKNERLKMTKTNVGSRSLSKEGDHGNRRSEVIFSLFFRMHRANKSVPNPLGTFLKGHFLGLVVTGSKCNDWGLQTFLPRSDVSARVLRPDNERQIQGGEALWLTPHHEPGTSHLPNHLRLIEGEVHFALVTFCRH